jgi:hypothetical protein
VGFVGRQKWLKRSDVNTDEYRRLVEKYKRDRIIKYSPVMTIPNAQAAWKHMDHVFQLPGYIEAKARYDQAKKQRKNAMWFSLDGGAKSLEDLAGRIGYPALYEVLYRSSFDTHGNNILQGNQI